METSNTAILDAMIELERAVSELYLRCSAAYKTATRGTL